MTTQQDIDWTQAVEADLDSLTPDADTPQDVIDTPPVPDEPAPVPEPQPEFTPPPPDELQALREENSRLVREREEQHQQAMDAQLQNAAIQFAQHRINQYIQQGYDENTARELGVIEAREGLNSYRAQQAILRATRIELSTQFGIPQEQLQQFQDEAAMRSYAEQYANTTGPQAKELQALRAEIEALKKGRVPAQSYNQPGSTGAQNNTPLQIWERYGRGELSWSPQVQKAGRELGFL